MAELTPKQARFVEEYLVDLNATQAAIRTGYSEKTAYSQGQRLLKDAEIAAAVVEAQKARSDRVEITADDVLRELWAIGTADPNELIEYRRGCCRYCWGEDFRYQFTEDEFRRHRRRYDEMIATADEDKPVGDFDPQGGVGFDARRDPNEDCPECFGEGLGDVIAKDTRKVSPAARRLYAGVKLTKDGLEIKMHDKVAALTKVGQHLGMFTDKIEHSGKDGAPLVPILNVTIGRSGSEPSS